MVLSELVLIAFKARKSIVTPPLTFAAPANGVCLQLGMAKEDELELSFWVLTIVLIISDASEALVGRTIQLGERRDYWKRYVRTAHGGGPLATTPKAGVIVPRSATTRDGTLKMLAVHILERLTDLKSFIHGKKSKSSL